MVYPETCLFTDNLFAILWFLLLENIHGIKKNIKKWLFLKAELGIPEKIPLKHVYFTFVSKQVVIICKVISGLFISKMVKM